MSKKSIIPIILIILLLPLTALAQTDGIPLQRDVFLEYPISTTEDLPDQVTFNLYDSKTATTPIGAQTFARGEYTVDFEFSKSDGVISGTVARVNANFTNKLNINDDPDTGTQTKEIWISIKMGGTEIADRTQVSDETLVQLLLSSDASIATYLTLAYKGDDNPITTIYKDLPISSLSSDDSGSSLNSYFSAVAAGTSEKVVYPNALVDPYWELSSPNIYYNNGYVGIGTSDPKFQFELHANTNSVLELKIDNDSLENAAYITYSFDAGAAHGNIYQLGSGWISSVQYLQSAFMMEASNGPLVLSAKNTSNGVIQFYTAGNNERMRIGNSGNIGIGTTNPTYKLSVNGTIRAKEIIVDTGWSDFVFEDGYRLPPLSEVERFISKNRHLPEIPTEADVKEKGVTLGNISSKLLQKIEELTLYLIELKKENDHLKAQVATIQAHLKK